MTRKDYELLARTLGRAKKNGGKFYTGIDFVIGAIASALSNENPRFNRQEFYDRIDQIANLMD